MFNKLYSFILKIFIYFMVGMTTCECIHLAGLNPMSNIGGIILFIVAIVTYIVIEVYCELHY